MQVDADIVGAASPLADAEICMMAADTMEALGFAPGEYAIRVSSRQVLDRLLDEIGLASADPRRLVVLRAIDKADKFPIEEIAKLLGAGRVDESGDVTKGADLPPEAVDSVLALLSPDGLNRITDDLRAIGEHATAAGYNSIRIDPSVVRGLEYYTGAVFEAELLTETTDEAGRPVRFGSVGGGGRYDGLVGRFRGENVPATGFSVGVSRLAAALAAREAGEPRQGPVIVTVMDRDSLPAYQAMTANLRAALNTGVDTPVPVEMYVGDAGFRAQMKYADRRGAPCVIIQGADERARGIVQIKDLAAGKEASQDISDRQEWIEARPAQIEVDDAIPSIAAAIRSIIGRHP